VATLIPSRQTPPRLSGDLAELFANTMWWEPDQAAAIDAIRDAIRDVDRAVASPRDFVLGHWTWEQATARLIEILSEVEPA
jgi:hypothetical protein